MWRTVETPRGPAARPGAGAPARRGPGHPRRGPRGQPRPRRPRGGAGAGRRAHPDPLQRRRARHGRLRHRARRRARGRTSRARWRCVWVDETRPVLQGSRLTAWELRARGHPAPAHRRHRGRLRDGRAVRWTCVVTGADRIAANGDTANKIGTYALAVLARHHGMPFYVAAPFSTIDPALPIGRPDPHRGARRPRSPPRRRPAHRRRRLPGLQPRLRRHPRRADHRHHHRARRLPPPLPLLRSAAIPSEMAAALDPAPEPTRQFHVGESPSTVRAAGGGVGGGATGSPEVPLASIVYCHT